MGKLRPVWEELIAAFIGTITSFICAIYVNFPIFILLTIAGLTGIIALFMLAFWTNREERPSSK